MPSPKHLQAAQRLAIVKQWLIEMGWTAQLEADGGATPIVEAVTARAKATWFADVASRTTRSRSLVARALLELRGEINKSSPGPNGGKPRKLATFQTLIGARVIVQISAIDMSRHEEFAARVISGNGSEFEAERIRPDGMTEIITIRIPDDDE